MKRGGGGGRGDGDGEEGKGEGGGGEKGQALRGLRVGLHFISLPRKATAGASLEKNPTLSEPMKESSPRH